MPSLVSSGSPDAGKQVFSAVTPPITCGYSECWPMRVWQPLIYAWVNGPTRSATTIWLWRANPAGWTFLPNERWRGPRRRMERTRNDPHFRGHPDLQPAHGTARLPRWFHGAERAARILRGDRDRRWI